MRTVALLMLGIVACTPGSDNVGEVDETSGSSGSSSTATATTSGGPGTTTGVDDETFCMQLDDPGTCAAAAAPESGFPCSWETFTPVTIEDGACVLGEDVAMCVLLSGNTTAAGCGPLSGCEAVPFYRFVDGTALMSQYCGGSPPTGWNECETSDPAVADPTECACLCDSAGTTGG